MAEYLSNDGHVKTDKEKWLKDKFYKTDFIVQSSVGDIDFSDKDMKELADPRITYDEYLKAQFAARGYQRTYFLMDFTNKGKEKRL